MKRLLLLIIFLVFNNEIKAQNFGLGGELIYNFQTESFGGGIRGIILPGARVSLSPQVSYYPSFNKVHEYTAGLSVEYKLFYFRNYFLYPLLHAGYNRWISYDQSAMENAKPDNWNGEIGLGISNNKCIRPFIEYRYNFRFRETQLHAGVLFLFGCRKGTGEKKYDCPSFKN